MQKLENFRWYNDERRERTPALSLAILTVTVQHQDRFCCGFVANRAASASASKGNFHKADRNFRFNRSILMSREDVQSFPGFEERFQAGKHARPTPGNFAGHFRTILEFVMHHREAYHVFNWLDFKSD